MRSFTYFWRTFWGGCDWLWRRSVPGSPTPPRVFWQETEPNTWLPICSSECNREKKVLQGSISKIIIIIMKKLDIKICSSSILTGGEHQRWCGSVGFFKPWPSAVLEQSAAECEAAGMKVSSSKSEAIAVPSGPVRRSLSISGSCSQVMASWSEKWTTDWGFVNSNEGAAPVRCGAFDLLVHLHSNTHLGRGMSGFPSWTCWLCNLTSGKWKIMDGWNPEEN